VIGTAALHRIFLDSGRLRLRWLVEDKPSKLTLVGHWYRCTSQNIPGLREDCAPQVVIGTAALHRIFLDSGRLRLRWLVEDKPSPELTLVGHWYRCTSQKYSWTQEDCASGGWWRTKPSELTLVGHWYPLHFTEYSWTRERLRLRWLVEDKPSELTLCRSLVPLHFTEVFLDSGRLRPQVVIGTAALHRIFLDSGRLRLRWLVEDKPSELTLVGHWYAAALHRIFLDSGRLRLRWLVEDKPSPELTLVGHWYRFALHRIFLDSGKDCASGGSAVEDKPSKLTPCRVIGTAALHRIIPGLRKIAPQVIGTAALHRIFLDSGRLRLRWLVEDKTKSAELTLVGHWYRCTSQNIPGLRKIAPQVVGGGQTV
ncbi:hypothetical protein RRG08_063085, partial [Elysia crispata]